MIQRRLCALAPLALAMSCSASPPPANGSSASTGASSSRAGNASASPRDAGHDVEGGCPPASSNPITLDTGTGVLAGTLELPGGCGPFPVVLFHSGSGPTDRDGNQLASGFDTDTIKQLALALVPRAVASVRYDKRGVGASAAAAPPEVDLRLATYVSDAAAWVRQLHADARFSAITFAGHSEGSLIGILAAQNSPVASFVSLAGPGRKLADVLKGQLANKLGEGLAEQADAIIDQLAAGQLVANVPTSLNSLFAPAVQPYLISELTVDPAVEIAKLAIPALVIQGTTDLQVSVQDAMLLAAAAKQRTLVVVDGMNHELKAATLDSASQAATRSNPMLPVEPKVIDALVRAVPR
jgi:pimeloyl-ACP methyl ester carboxylesterase